MTREPIDDLLRATEMPLPLRGDREDDLLAELLADLDKGPLVVSSRAPDGSETEDAAVVRLERTSTSTRPPTRRWVVPAAAGVLAAAAIVVALAVGIDRGDELESVGGSPPTSTEVVSIDAVCQAFAAAAPDRIDVATSLDPEAIRAVLVAFDDLLASLEARSDIDDATSASLDLARGRLSQAVLLAEAGQDAASAFDGAWGELRDLDDPRFDACGRF